MRQAIMTTPGKIEFRDVESPKPGPGQVLIRVQRIGICGSDVHVWHGKHPYTSYPVIQGHEYSATVEEVGQGVEGIKIGSKVTATPQEVCGKCKPCQRGDYHICDTLKVQGFQAPGVAQDFFVTEAEKIVPLPDSFSFEQGALVEPVSVAVHCVNRVESVKNKNVAVLGAGPIGNLVAQVAQAEGAKVLITDLSDFRLDIAKKCNLQNITNAKNESFEEAVARVFGKDGFDIAFECVGVEQTMTDAIENIQKGGSIVVVGVFAEKARVDLGLVQDRELKLFGTLMYKYEDYLKAVDHIESGKVITDPLFTRHFPFSAYNEVYNFIDEQGDKTMKVFIDL
jgi:2-desacetyl-2-hydroxyethyl bacteriochlorophyllide A dehydrogenase